MNTKRTPLLVLMTIVGAGAFMSVACSSGSDATNPDESRTAVTNATDDGGKETGAVLSGPSKSTGDDEADADAGTDAGSATACADTVAASNACSAVLDGGSAANGCLDYGGCYDFQYNLTASTYASAANCVDKISSCQAGNPQILTCVQTALSGACPDPSTASYCQQIATSLSSCTQGTPADAGSMGDCQQLLSGMTTAGRQSFVKCATESCADPSVVADCLTFVMSEAMD